MELDSLESFFASLSLEGQARVAGFLASVAGEAAPDELEGPGHGQEASPFYGDPDYADGHRIGQIVGDISEPAAG